MEYPYLSPSLVAGQATRQLHPLRRWVEIREFYLALLGRRRQTAANQLTRLTVSVWDRPDRYC